MAHGSYWNRLRVTAHIGGWGWATSPDAGSGRGKRGRENSKAVEPAEEGKENVETTRGKKEDHKGRKVGEPWNGQEWTIPGYK